MRIRTLGFLGLGEAFLSAVVLGLLSLVPGAFPDPGMLALVWLVPIAFGLHVFEEFGFPGGFAEWSIHARPDSAKAMTPAHLFRVNVLGGAAAAGVALGAFDYRGGYGWFGIRAWLVLLGTLAVNAVSHLAGSVHARRYSPGVVSAGLLYVPLSVAGVVLLLRRGVVDLVSGATVLAVGVPAYLLLIRSLRRRAIRDLDEGSGDRALP